MSAKNLYTLREGVIIIKTKLSLLFILVILLILCCIQSDSDTFSMNETSNPIDLETAVDLLCQKYGVPDDAEVYGLDMYYAFEGMYSYNGMSCYKFRARDHMDGYWVTACFLIVTPDGENVFELIDSD